VIQGENLETLRTQIKIANNLAEFNKKQLQNELKEAQTIQKR
jgi:hypothetical protein